MRTVTIIDYGMGNLRSVQKGFEKVGSAALVTADPREVEQAERLVLPGVGAFRDCMDNLRQGGFIEPILRHVESGRPFLGICLGLQLLFTESEEFGRHQGLDIIPVKVVRFPTDLRQGDEELKVPHMGWNQIEIRRPAPVFKGVEDGVSVYFVHSYYVVPEDESAVATVTDYGIPFCSAVWRDNVMATQFHPEKSQQVGLQILKNFAKL
jgi:glutamine amidotransferase